MHPKQNYCLFVMIVVGLSCAILTGTVQASTPVGQAGTDAPAIGYERLPISAGSTGQGQDGPAAPTVSAGETIQPDSQTSLETVLTTAGDFTLSLDDGSAEFNVGIGAAREMLFLNRFTPAANLYPFMLNEIRVFFSGCGGVRVGDDITLVVYENTSANTDPSNGAVLRAQVPATVKATNIWSTYTLATPIVLNGPGDVLIGVVAMEKPGTEYYPAAIDVTHSAGRSWAGWWTASPPSNFALPPDGSWSLTDTEGNAGNWMIRGYGTTSNRFIYLPLVTR
ncbi:hypothetical protein LARV_01612 [Longilinea arvoryzae]|uniref:Uncharacterized protein n=1 Tax=Longilinea arvoryzae TaxID=360412 RepID=A0A0S7B9A5_9CHLR|nr:hypothetical protein [Longilinea arvoryzae]GAP13854.1 hypothetical protein LARV_01612 [Longilinea arvoryzae]